MNNINLITNRNVGIEYEYAILYLLSSREDQDKFMNDVIMHHFLKNKICKIISNMNINPIIDKLKDFGLYTIYLATQMDEIGPADVVLINNENKNLGLSVKYNNNCLCNISSEYFLSKENIKMLKDNLFSVCEKYIDEMNSIYGNPKNWFRRRKQSFETKTFIDTIREVVINDWNLKTKDEKNAIFSKLLHINSAIEFWELKIKKRKNKYNINLNENPITMPNMDTIELVKYADSYIGFKSNNIIFAKMQIKFNNGILESPKNNKYDFIENNIPMKIGTPFTSWNFSYLK